jgi:multiple sugar transport system ATP-binding protein
MNLVEASLDEAEVRFGGVSVPLDSRRPALANGTVVLGIRPESFEDAAYAQPGLPQLEVDVAVVEELGAETHLIFPIDAQRVDAEDVKAAADEEESAALLAEDTRALFTARVDPRTTARPGATARLAIDPAGLYFFDAATGDSLLTPKT